MDPQEQIAELVEERALALHRGEHLWAQRISNQIVEQQALLRQHCPVYETYILRGDEIFIFVRVTPAGDVVYRRATSGDDLMKMQEEIPKAFRYARSGLIQKGMTALDRLRAEHLSEVNAAHGARFSSPDVMIGVALTGVSRGTDSPAPV